MRFKVVLQETAFYTIVVDADDVAQAEETAKYYTRTFPGSARKHARQLMRWHIEQQENDNENVSDHASC